MVFTEISCVKLLVKQLHPTSKLAYVNHKTIRKYQHEGYTTHYLSSIF